MSPQRRAVLSLSLLAALASCAASSAAPAPQLSPLELRRIEGRDSLSVVTRDSPEAAILRRRALEVPEGMRLEALAASMERALRTAGGVGLAGPQVGVPLRVALLLLGYARPGARAPALFVRNPVIVERSDETVPSYEGCLSVPGLGGLLRRSRWVRVRYQTLGGQPAEARAEGADAILWQHEIDHLDGTLYLDRLIGEPMSLEEMRRRRKLLESPAASRPGP